MPQQLLLNSGVEVVACYVLLEVILSLLVLPPLLDTSYSWLDLPELLQYLFVSLVNPDHLVLPLADVQRSSHQVRVAEDIQLVLDSRVNSSCEVGLAGLLQVLQHCWLTELVNSSLAIEPLSIQIRHLLDSRLAGVLLMLPCLLLSWERRHGYVLLLCLGSLSPQVFFLDKCVRVHYLTHRGIVLFWRQQLLRWLGVDLLFRLYDGCYCFIPRRWA